MSYLSFYSPLLRELGQGYSHLARIFPMCDPDMFFHGNLRDIWGRRVNHGFGDTDVHESASRIKIVADLPGIQRNNMKVNCNGDILSILGERNSVPDLTDDVYSSVERAFGSVCKHIRLPHNCDVSTITADYQDGVLTIDISKPDVNTNPGKEVTIAVSCCLCYN